MAEVAALLSALPADMALLARLLYGTGMRLMEGLRLRVKDVDFDRGWSWYARPRATCIDPVNSCTGVNVEGNDDEHPDGRRHQALDSQA